MGVDLSVSIAVGFVIDPDVLKKYRMGIPADDDYSNEELLEDLVEGSTEFTTGTAGSYYDSGEDNRQYIAIRRLTTRYSDHDIPGGVVGLSKPTITLAEREALNVYAKRLGEPNPEIGQFTAVLWH